MNLCYQNAQKEQMHYFFVSSNDYYNQSPASEESSFRSSPLRAHKTRYKEIYLRLNEALSFQQNLNFQIPDQLRGLIKFIIKLQLKPMKAYIRGKGEGKFDRQYYYLVFVNLHLLVFDR
ncbi:hypothetical protein TTHERM_00219400 (macronuclear) [Tetrahymena thermophila SB210]|uniref:Uncharacterized protein n=1 Tax=Tetrahymena thermophila (strain SB210) TaxID=312017 RepID=I7M8Z9_TETTS|nr:hypothetical protein TTHERM_00219400 [Tetrahymena thermophila SB210]EAS00367.2 hypothetical protein TTHERM_00219400 [Tetrahymena thermophila SB210]|eukprot:XP_001020612.2 hypothetical protein TTHERM_00219400 [Tetrahymena thermophila SB210]